MTTCTLKTLSKLKDPLDIASQLLEGSKPFSYCLLSIKENKLWDFYYVIEGNEISHHRIKCYKFGKVTVYKNAGMFLSRTLEGLMTHLIGRPLSSCFQIRLDL